MEISPQELVSSAKAVIFDSDGVLVEEGTPLPGAANLINHLLETGKIVVVLSNNSTKHPETMKSNYHEKGLMVSNIVNSGMLAVEFCKREGITKVLVVGEQGLIDLLAEHGIFTTDGHPEAVLVGMDRTLTYSKLATATRAIRSGSRFIGTNPDTSFPTARGLEPGAGSMIGALIASTDRQPEIILGKPETFGYEYVLENYGLNSSDCVMIGDRYETDILGAIRSQIPAIVVRTGIAATREDPGRWKDNPSVPVVESLLDLIG
ncbi:MAG: HAD-IIA family hydrolase [Candidatus Kariarchaeaceae archaeon]|jgi:HAD superfamily hydrolase (TIGR01450 family)